MLQGQTHEVAARQGGVGALCHGAIRAAQQLGHDQQKSLTSPDSRVQCARHVSRKADMISCAHVHWTHFWWLLLPPDHTQVPAWQV